MKTCPNARLGSRKPKKGVQNALEHESAISTKSTIRHFQSVEWHLFGLWPNSFWVMIRHILFDFFVERRVLMRILPVVAYFLSIPASINRDWISKFRHSFMLSKRHFFMLSNFSYFWPPLFWNSLSYVKDVLEALVLRISFL